jgi:hypothetical protein
LQDCRAEILPPTVKTLSAPKVFAGDQDFSAEILIHCRARPKTDYSIPEPP